MTTPQETPPHDISTRHSKQREENKNEKSQAPTRTRTVYTKQEEEVDRKRTTDKRGRWVGSNQDNIQLLWPNRVNSQYNRHNIPNKSRGNRQHIPRRKTTRKNMVRGRNNRQNNNQQGKKQKEKPEQETNKAAAKQHYLHTKPLDNPCRITHHQDRRKRKAQGDLDGNVERERETRGRAKRATLTLKEPNPVRIRTTSPRKQKQNNSGGSPLRVMVALLALLVRAGPWSEEILGTKKARAKRILLISRAHSKAELVTDRLS